MVKPLEGSLQKLSASTLTSIWRKRGQTHRLGLAISGGVDSMALASLCSQTIGHEAYNLIPTTPVNASFTAFIVNHKLREGSTAEAEQVASELSKLNIEPCILELDWREYGDPSSLSNIESIARRLRYRALGKACRDRGINSLLVAHHADDQAETIMTRIVTNYMGTGLAGIKPASVIPECEGIYGVDHSGFQQKSNDDFRMDQGQQRILSTESGGVTIVRPLLAFKKNELIDVCKQRGIRWFEDHTNVDPQVTVRNTVRHLQKVDMLPNALRTARLLGLAGVVDQERKVRESNALDAFQDLPMNLDLRVGKVEYSITKPIPASLRALALRMVVALVAPKETIALQGLYKHAEFALSRDRADYGDSLNVIQTSGVTIREELASSGGQPTWSCHRALPTQKEKTDLKIKLVSPQGVPKDSWTDWCLWDSRYWIRVCSPSGRAQRRGTVSIRFLGKADLASLRKGMATSEAQKLDRSLLVAKGSIRFTLPAIVFQCDSKSPEQVVALPSLGWSVQGWKRCKFSRPVDEGSWMWEIRYKQIEIGKNELHQIES